MLEWIFYGNSTRTWLLALLAAALAWLVAKGVQRVLIRSLQHLSRRTRTRYDDVALAVLRGTRQWFFLALALWAGSNLLILPERLRDLVAQALVLAVLGQIGVWGGIAIRAHVSGYTAAREDQDGASITTIRAIGFLATVALWAVLLLMALDNAGVDITALVAGLGVGGVAVALAVQNILGDLFASLSIVLDKPFVYGDFIAVGDLAGTVEYVGLKTTRLRSISGEQLVFSNSDLLQSRIRNYKRMQERRIAFTLGVVYETSPDDLARIPETIRTAVEALPDLRFDRAHLKGLGASSLDFEVVYFVTSPDFNLYMDRQQAINLELLRRFQAEGIEFAYPTQTLYLAGAAAEEPTGPGPRWQPKRDS